MTPEQQFAVERKVMVAVLQHTLHRVDEFFAENPVNSFGNEPDPLTIAAVYIKWVSRQDLTL